MRQTPSLPSQAAIPVTPASPGFGNTVLAPRSGVALHQSANAYARPRYARRVRPGSSRARAAVTAEDKKIDSKFSICRGC